MALSLGRFVLTRVATVVIVVVGVTGLTWLAVNALRPDLRAGDDRLIFVALADYLQSAFLHFDFGRSSTSGREIEELIRQGLPADPACSGAAFSSACWAGSRAAPIARHGRGRP